MNPEPPNLLNTAAAAKLMGYTKTATMRSVHRFAMERGFGLQAPQELWPDKRTPMYAEDLLLEYRDVVRPNRLWSVGEGERESRLADYRKNARPV